MTMKTINFQAKADGDTVDMRIYEPIGEWYGMVSAAMVADALDEYPDAKTINLRIKSPGGSVFDGMAIYNQLADHPAKVNVIVDGIAASAASLIAMAGDTITMNVGSRMMIHNASGLTLGTAKDHTKQAKVLAGIDGDLAAIYAKRTGGDAGAIAELMDEETWMTAQEAVDDGFADSVAGTDTGATAHFDLSMFTNVPRDVAERFGLREKPQPRPEQPDMTPEQFKAQHKDIVDGWLNDEHAAGYDTAKTELTAMLEACGGDKAQAVQNFLDGKTVQQAKDAHAASLSQQLAEAKAALAAAQAKADELSNGGDPIKTAPDAAIKDEPTEDDAKKAKVFEAAKRIKSEYARNAYISSLGLNPGDFKFD